MISFKSHINEAYSKDVLQLVMLYRHAVNDAKKGRDIKAYKAKIYEYEKKLNLPLGKF